MLAMSAWCAARNMLPLGIFKVRLQSGEAASTVAAKATKIRFDPSALSGSSWLLDDNSRFDDACLWSLSYNVPIGIR